MHLTGEKLAQVLPWFTHNLQLKSDKFLELISLNYCCLIIKYMKFWLENFLSLMID